MTVHVTVASPVGTNVAIEYADAEMVALQGNESTAANMLAIGHVLADGSTVTAVHDPSVTPPG